MIKLSGDKELEFRALLDSYYSTADTAFTAEISTLANEGWDYYYGKRPIAAITGGSTYVDRSVFEAVNGTLQDLLNVFTSGEEYAAVKTPKGDVGATQYINRTLLRENAGYNILSSALKECLVVRNSFVKYFWEDSFETIEEEFNGMTEDELQAYLIEKEAQVVFLEEDEFGLNQGVLSYTKNTSGIRLQYAPLEEVIFDPAANSIRETSYLCHRTQKTREELYDMGFSQKKLDSIGAGDQRLYYVAYEMARSAGRISKWGIEEDHRDGNSKITLCEHYIRTSLLDKKNRVKLYQVFTAGSHGILEINEVDHIPFVTCTPFNIPGNIYGESVVDITKDIQDIKSALMRGYIDNIHNANHGSVLAIQGQYNKRDLIDNRPRRIVEINQPGAITPFPYNPLPAGIDNLLEHVETAKEVRTGVTRIGQGLNADVFKNDNAFATVNQAMTAAMNRLRMVARNIAENFMKELIVGMYAMARKYDTRPFNVENFMGIGQLVPQRDWPEQMEVCVEVAIGAAEKKNYANTLIQAFQMLMQAPMLAGSAFTTQNAHYLAYNAMKYMGIRDLPMALTPMSMVQPPQPDPMKQLEAQEKQAIIAEKQASAQEKAVAAQVAAQQGQIDMQKMMFEQQVAADDFKLRVQDFMSKGQREADRTMNEQYENQIRVLREQLEAQMKTSDVIAKQEEAADKVAIEMQKLELEKQALRIQEMELQLKAQEIQAKMQLESMKLQTGLQMEEKKLQQAEINSQRQAEQADKNLQMQGALKSKEIDTKASLTMESNAQKAKASEEKEKAKKSVDTKKETK